MFLDLFLPPTLPPAPLCPPPGAERGALIWFRRAGCASIAREDSAIPAGRNWRVSGRRELARICAPRLAAAPASGETFPSCLVNNGPRSGRCRWHAQALPITTTAGMQSRLTSHGGDASLLRSLCRNQKPNPGSLLYPGGGREGRGDEWGTDQASQTQKAAHRQRQKQKKKT